MSNTSAKKTAAQAAAEAEAAAAAAAAAADIADRAAVKAQAAQTEQFDSATQEALAIEAENAALEAQAAADRAAAAAQEALEARSAQDLAAAAAAAAARDANASRAARAAAAAQEAGKARGANAVREEQEANASRASAAARAAQESAERAIRLAQEQASQALAAVRAAEERAAQAALAAKLAQEEEEQEAVRADQANRFSESERVAQAADAAYSSKAAQAAREAQSAADRAALAALAARAARANRAVRAAKEIAVARETQAAKAGQAAQAAHAAVAQAVLAARAAAVEQAARETEAARAADAAKSVHVAQENAESAAAERAMRAAEAAQKAQTAHALQSIQADHAARADWVFDATQSARDAQYCAARAAEAAAARTALAVQADRASRADKGNAALKNYAERVDKEAQQIIEQASQVDNASQEAQDAVIRAANATLLSAAEQAARAAASSAVRATQIVSAIVPANTLQLPSRTAPAQARQAAQGEQVLYARPDSFSQSGQPVPAYAQPDYSQSSQYGQFAQSGQSTYAQPAPAGAYNRPDNTASSYSQQFGQQSGASPAYGQPGQYGQSSQSAYSQPASGYVPANVQPGASAPFSQAGARPVLGNDSIVPNFEFPNPYGQPELVPVGASGQTVKPKTAQSGQTLYSNPGFQSATPGYYSVSGENDGKAAQPFSASDRSTTPPGGTASAPQSGRSGAQEEGNIATRTISTSATRAQPASPFGGASFSSDSTSARTSTNTAPGVSTSPLKNILNLDPDAAARREKIAETEIIKAARSDRYAHVSVARPGVPANAEPTQDGDSAAWATLNAGTDQGGSESAIRAAALVARDAANRPVSRAQLRQFVNVQQSAGKQSGQAAGASTSFVEEAGAPSGDSQVRDAQIALPPGVTKSSFSTAAILIPAANTPQGASSTNAGNLNGNGNDSGKPSAASASTGTSVSADAAQTAQPAPVAEARPLTIAERIRAKQVAAAAAKRTGVTLPADAPAFQTDSSSRSTAAPSGGTGASVTTTAAAGTTTTSSTTSASVAKNVPAGAANPATASVKFPTPDSPAARLLSIGGSSPNLSGAGTTITTTRTSRTSALDADGGKSTTSTVSTVTSTEKVALSSEKTGGAAVSTKDRIAAAAAAARKNRDDDDDDDDDEGSSSRSATNGTAGLIPEEKKKSKAGCIFALLALLLLALLAAYYFIIRPGNAVSPYLSTHLQTRTLKSTVKTTGNVKPVKEVNVGSEIPGLVLKVYVDSNDTVKKGDKLAMIDTTKIQQQMDAASAALKNAQARENEASATYNETQLKLGRYKDAFQKSQGKTPSKLELERAQADFDRADALKRAAAESVKEASSQLEVHKTDLGKALIVAPIDGIVLERKIEPGAVVQPSFQVETLFVIAENLEHVKVVVGVSEADIGKVKSGQRATFTVSAFTGKTFEAEVTKVEKASRIDNNVVVYNTELKIPNTDPNFVLRSGMTADVVISTGESKPGAFVVPISALRFNPNATNSVAKKNESFASKIFRFPARNRGTPVEKGVSLNSIDKPQIWERKKNGALHAIPVVIGVDDGKDVEISGENLTSETEILFGNS